MLVAIQTFQAGDYEVGITQMQAVVRQHPDHVEALSNLGAMLGHIGRHLEAVPHLLRAAELAPDNATAHSNLARSLSSCSITLVDSQTGQLPAALDALTVARKAVELDPSNVDAWNNLGTIALERTLMDEAMNAYRRALEVNPDCHEAHSNYLMVLQYDPEVTAETVFQETEKWGEQANKALRRS